ncbi:hypothetical protein Nepgr_012685 [Nepenthes gracilis]|uniref:ENTH domain-containing protein n=1 Tax=Nepenthes gracilis TaxID=150966 RepID=A0AAD3XND9_NEPGR|nr:hypothetical protein Nepgr_012685 [Nepenthes gracilis]
MAPSIRKAMGVVKDQTSIGLAKVASNMAPDLEVAIVKATSHDNDPADEKYIRQILTLSSYSRAYVDACISAVSKRLGKTRDWVVALKALMLVHRLLSDGDPIFQQEILYATRRGTRLLNMSDFRDEAHPNSWDHSAFVRAYALYLDQRLELMLFERKQGGNERGSSGHGGEIVRYEPREDRWRSPPSRYDYDYREFGGGPGNGRSGMRRTRSFGDFSETAGREENKTLTELKDMKPEQIFAKMGHLQNLFDRFLSCRLTGLAKNCRMILVALYPVVKESFKLYGDICEVLAVLLDRFFDMEHSDCVKALEAYASAAKQINELLAFYNWCKDTGLARSSEFPEVQRITDSLLETLGEFVRDRSMRAKSPERKLETPAPSPKEEEPVEDMNAIKALPPPENYAPPSPKPQAKPQQQVTDDLVNLRDDTETADDQGNKLALALFAGPPANNTDGSWQAFPSNGEPEVTSAWQTPAAELGKEDWELALVESASNLSKQKATLGGGFDPLLLNGIYDQGMVRQHVSTAQLSGGSASSVALPLPGKSTTPVLALPAPDGTLKTVGHDPFAASMNFPPPSYVQMADLEKKQQLLAQEQLVWQQYAREGMQGQTSFAKISGAGYHALGATPLMPGAMPAMPYGMLPSGYYYAPF